MSIVIIGGHDRMVCQYKNICKNYNCKFKIFTQIPGRFKEQIGCPDLIILFTNTVSHKMVSLAVKQAEKNKITIARSHSSSKTSLEDILNKHCNFDI